MDNRIITTDVMEEDFSLEGNLRPQSLDEYIGQEKTKNTLKVYIEAAKRLNIDISDCVVFEDIYMGMKSANEAGFFTVIMEDESSKRQREQLKAEAGIYITDFSQLLEKESLF